ncbi:SDR family oxidoreductase [Pedobacter sp. SYSU D00535]|uniref:SDR family oxidoreductase n=1 Tax=Pedobacter sp. SYSU D00535 TaxID=2810308 RepID=UPI001A97C2E3|nr:SDR family oxidoreductase [Pedobacter sp. SYSU D00535]
MNKETRNLIADKALYEKTVVITGASSGAGRAAALSFAEEGATVVLAARRVAALEEVVEECLKLGGKAIAIPTDVTDTEAVKQLAAAAQAATGCIDVWINNAGVLAAGEFEQTPVEVHDRVIETNLMGYLHGAHAALPYFKDQGFGVLINNISVGAWVPTPYAVGYSASKYGLLGLSEALRGELTKWPAIHVCDLFPAFLDTPGIQHAANYTGKELMPAPPVFNPQRVAEAMVALAKKPHRSKITDLAAPFFRLGYTLFPKLTMKFASSMMETYFNRARKISSTPGNLFIPLKFGTSVSGGWKSRLKHRSAKSVSPTIFIVGAIAGILAFSRWR